MAPFLIPLILAVSLVLAGPRAHGAIQIPENLSGSDRLEALNIIGFGTSSKILADPWPLGGYAGIEIGIAIENLPAEDLGRLGSRLASPQQDVAYPKLSLGKGLYHDVDVFVNFTPYNRSDELSQYGGLLRWSFYQAKFLPLSASVLAHANSLNIGNRMSTRSYGADLVGGINADNVALYAGLGVAEATGTFIGGSEGITDTGSVESASSSSLHTLIGTTIRLGDFFLSLQIDRYTLPVFSGKLGVRF